MSLSQRISVIIPVLNEANSIQDMLQHLRQASNPNSNLEIIVVDGGSKDQTVTLARTAGATVIASAPGRAAQMNAGAIAASGDVLIFVHADTHLPKNFAYWVHQTLVNPKVAAGAFELKIDGSMPGLRLVEWGVKWRSRLLQMPYGDQALFLRTQTFREMKGFANLPIMEDFEFVSRLKDLGRVAIAPASVLTSGRRWQKLGILQTTLLNQMIIIAYWLGISPEWLAHWYRHGLKPYTKNK